MTRRVSGLQLIETADRLPKLKPEKRDEFDVLADSGDVELVNEPERGGDDGLNAVLRRRRDCRACSGRKDRDSEDMVWTSTVGNIVLRTSATRLDDLSTECWLLINER